MSTRPAAQAILSAWYDLSHSLGVASPRLATFPAPEIRRLLSRPADPMQVTAIDLCCHVGTHIDAPVHFVEAGATIDELALDRLHGDGVVLDIACKPYQVIDVRELEDASPEVRDEDIVFVCTGWSDYVGEPRYDEHPSLSVEAAVWLAERHVKLVGVDFGTPDVALHRRAPGFDWPVHRALLGRGSLVAEHLRGLRALAGCRVEVMCLPLNIQGADGAPARIVARSVDGG